jgi:ketosteroid isomerase-like protein
MSQENVKVVQRLYALLSQGDYNAVLALVSPQFVFDFSRRLINPVVLRGPDQVSAFAEHEMQVWEEDRVSWKPKELIDAGDRVLAFILTSGRGKTSGVQVEAHVWNMWAFRDDKPIALTYFGEDRAGALDAAGLSEQDAHADSP